MPMINGHTVVKIVHIFKFRKQQNNFNIINNYTIQANRNSEQINNFSTKIIILTVNQQNSRTFADKKKHNIILIFPK